MKHFVVSDFHLNMGKLPDGRRHPLEDFDGDEQFDTLIELALKDAAPLIINGDWIDFLQLEPFDEIARRSASGLPLAYTAAEALQKLETCFTTQPRHFASLARYLADGGTLTIVQGNHDADWFFPALSPGDEAPLQARLREVLKPPAPDALRFVDDYLRLGTVHVEHGHQRCEILNAFHDHPRIFHRDNATPLLGRERIELIRASRFVMTFFNQLEARYPFADNLKPTTRALWLGIKNGWVNGRVAADFLWFFYDTGVPLRALSDVLDGPESATSMIQQLPDDDLRALFYGRMAHDREFERDLTARASELRREEVRRAAPQGAEPTGREEVVAPPREGGATLNLLRDRRELRSARELLKTADGAVTAVIFGHTHQEIDGAAKDAPVSGYFNTGTWTPRLDLEKPAIQQMLQTQSFPVEALGNPALFDTRFMYAVVDESDTASGVELREIILS